MDKKVLGSYYTPNKTAIFMVKLALASYIKASLKPITKSRALTLLKNVQILDPACGDGAILKAALKVLAAMRKKLGDTTANIEESIIKNNLYALDVDEAAAALCRKTFFNTTTADALFYNLRHFNIIIANPPYISSSTMAKNNSPYRASISKKYNLKGNWDMYMAFFKMSLAAADIVTFLTPNKWLSKDSARAFRESTIARLALLANTGNIFLDATVDSLISVFTLDNTSLSSKNTYNKITLLGGSRAITVDKNELPPQYNIDEYYSDNHAFIKNIESVAAGHISDLALCENACSVSDAYKLKEYIKDAADNSDLATPPATSLNRRDNGETNSNAGKDDIFSAPNEHLTSSNPINILDKSRANKKSYDSVTKSGATFRLLTTASIGKYTNYWGVRPIRYLKRTYKNPVLYTIGSLGETYARRATSPKVICKSLNLLDAFIDEEGRFLPAIPTIVITVNNIIKESSSPKAKSAQNSKAMHYKKSKSARSGCKISLNKSLINEIDRLKLICAIINSRVARTYLTNKYPSSTYCGSPRYTPAMIGSIPLPALNSEQVKKIIALTDSAARDARYIKILDNYICKVYNCVIQ